MFDPFFILWVAFEAVLFVVFLMVIICPMRSGSEPRQAIELLKQNQPQK